MNSSIQHCSRLETIFIIKESRKIFTFPIIVPTFLAMPFKVLRLCHFNTHILQATLVIGLDMRPGASLIGQGHVAPGLDAFIEVALQVANAIGLSTNEGCLAAVPERPRAAGMVWMHAQAKSPAALLCHAATSLAPQLSCPRTPVVTQDPKVRKYLNTLKNGGAIERSIDAAVPMHGAPGTADLRDAAGGSSDISMTETLAAKVPATLEHQTHAMFQSMQHHRTGHGIKTTRPSRVRRRIANSTCLRVLFVTSGMFETLLPDLGLQGEEHGYALSESMDQRPKKSVQHGGMASSSVESESSSDGFHCHQPAVNKLGNKVAGRPHINTTILINDSNKRQWSVAFVTQDNFNQYHRRLWTGWAGFCEANDVRIGDTVEFRRLPGRIINLHARVLRGSGNAR